MKNFKRFWNNFWYDYETIGPIRWGGQNNYRKIFRKGRLSNIVFGTIISLIILWIIFQ